jgi:hypothetical protein
LVQVQDWRKIGNHFRGIYRVYSKLVKGEPKAINMQPVGLGNTWMLTDVTQNLRVEVAHDVHRYEAR